MAIELNERELATILASLRLWQETGNRQETEPFEVATDGGTVEPLNDEEIDELCEKINCDSDFHVCGDECRSNGCTERFK